MMAMIKLWKSEKLKSLGWKLLLQVPCISHFRSHHITSYVIELRHITRPTVHTPLHIESNDTTLPFMGDFRNRWRVTELCLISITNTGHHTTPLPPIFPLCTRNIPWISDMNRIHLSYAMLCYAARNRAVPTVQCHLYILRRSQYLRPHLSLRTSTSLSYYFPTYSFFSYSLSASSSPFPLLPLTQTLMHYCPSPPHTLSRTLPLIRFTMKWFSRVPKRACLKPW